MIETTAAPNPLHEDSTHKGPMDQEFENLTIDVDPEDSMELGLSGQQTVTTVAAHAGASSGVSGGPLPIPIDSNLNFDGSTGKGDALSRQSSGSKDTPKNDKHYTPTGTNVFIAGIPSGWDEQKIAELCEPFGEVVSVKLVTNRHYAFVMFSDHKAAEAAIKALHYSRVPPNSLLHVAEAMHDEGAEETPGNRLFIRGLPKGMSRDELHRLFAPYGVITECTILYSPDGQCKGVAFVQFADVSQATAAKKDMHGKKLEHWNFPLMVRYSETAEVRQVRQQRQRERMLKQPSPNHAQQVTVPKLGQSPTSGNHTPNAMPLGHILPPSPGPLTTQHMVAQRRLVETIPPPAFIPAHINISTPSPSPANGAPRFLFQPPNPYGVAPGPGAPPQHMTVQLPPPQQLPGYPQSGVGPGSGPVISPQHQSLGYQSAGLQPGMILSMQPPSPSVQGQQGHPQPVMQGHPMQPQMLHMVPPPQPAAAPAPTIVMPLTFPASGDLLMYSAPLNPQVISQLLASYGLVERIHQMQTGFIVRMKDRSLHATIATSLTGLLFSTGHVLQVALVQM